MIGDEGSGYWIGREALPAVMRDADGRGPATRLSQQVLAHFDVADVSSLRHIVYDRTSATGASRRSGRSCKWPASRRRGGVGDSRARRRRARTGGAIGRERLRDAGDAFPFVLAGGVFRVVPWLVDGLRPRAARGRAARQIDLLREEPALGAVWLALAEARGGARVPKYT